MEVGGKKKTGPVEEFTFGRTSPLPSGGSVASDAIKPGHWFSLRQPVRSNKDDQRGALSYYSSWADGPSELASRGDKLAPITSERPAVLPKGRTKQFDLRLLASHEPLGDSRRIATYGYFSSPSSAATPPRTDFLAMGPQEYFFTILTQRPERFATFQVADWVRPPIDENAITSVASNYRIVFPRGKGLLALPDTMLDWTSTAVLFWDDVAPSELTPDQRRALLDWLYFGGRLIVNGDVAVAELAASDLGKLLPINVNGMTDLDGESAAMLIEKWSVASDDSIVTTAALARNQATRIAVAGDLRDGASVVEGTHGLIASRSIGRGTIVMSRFDLTSDWLSGWRSRDSFFNAAILGRPARSYSFDSNGTRQTYIGSLNSPSGAAAINTSFRLAVKDARLSSTVSAERDEDDVTPADETKSETQWDPAFRPHPVAGFGSWRDDSDLALRMQSLLKEQAGVTIPSLRFVMRSLALYLFALIPLNYLVFRLIGRLEWAWLSIPILALVGAAWIARTVSLDLGLARTQSEVALLEMQTGYARAHVTRFTSVYNSLSSSYEIRFSHRDSAAAPAGIFQGSNTDVSPVTFRYGYSDGPSIHGFTVPSNRTRVLHSEQIVELGGSINFTSAAISNDTKSNFTDCYLIRKTIDGTVDQARLGTLDSGATAKLRWTKSLNTDIADTTNAMEHGNSITTPLVTADSIPIGTVRMVAKVVGVIPGLEIFPSMPQQNNSTFLLVDLEHLPQNRSQGDSNLLPTKRERDVILLNAEDDETTVKEITVP